MEADELNGLPEGAEDPNVLKVVFMTGAGGTGKSKIAKSMFGSSLRYINQDTHLERFMKEAGEPLSRVGARYDLFKRAQNLKNKEVAHHGQRRAGIIIDVTGWEAKRVINPLNRFRALGYDAMMVFVRTSLQTALDRNAKRSRNVPDSFIRTAHAGSLKNLPLFTNAFGSANTVVIDNDKDIDPKDWAKHVAPQLHKVAMEFLRRPVKNAKGKAWLATQQVESTLQVPVIEAPPLFELAESRWTRYEREQPLTEEFTSRYDALGIPEPDPETMCKGQCEGTGVVPIEGPFPEGTDYDPKVRERLARCVDSPKTIDDLEEPWRTLWLEAEAENPNKGNDRWHFVTCPTCKGTRKDESSAAEDQLPTAEPSVNGSTSDVRRSPVRVILPAAL